jgi:hypothetical protein
MCKRRSVILAAGKQDRFGSHELKQLLPVFGVPLIVRTQEQFDYPTVVTKHWMIAARSRYVFPPFSRGCICETLLSTRTLWGSERTTVLLGDVFYDDFTADRINNCMDSFRVFVDSALQEIYAITWTSDLNDAVELCLFEAIKNYRNRHGKGKLWEFYRSYCKADLNKHNPEKLFHYMKTVDRTQDFDTIEQYYSFINTHTP